MHVLPLPWLGKCTLVKRGGVKLDLWYKTQEIRNQNGTAKYYNSDMVCLLRQYIFCRMDRVCKNNQKSKKQFLNFCKGLSCSLIFF
jgi:hypothetical protein